MKTRTIPKRKGLEQNDYLQKSGLFTSVKEIQSLGVESSYYKVLERETKSMGFDNYEEK